MQVQNPGDELHRSRIDEPLQSDPERPRNRARGEHGLPSFIANSLAEEVVDAKPPVLKDEEDDSTDDLDALEVRASTI